MEKRLAGSFQLKKKDSMVSGSTSENKEDGNTLDEMIAVIVSPCVCVRAYVCAFGDGDKNYINMQLRRTNAK